MKETKCKAWEEISVAKGAVVSALAEELHVEFSALMNVLKGDERLVFSKEAQSLENLIEAALDTLTFTAEALKA